MVLINTLLEMFSELDKNLENKIAEISVKSSQITIRLLDSLMISRKDFNTIDSFSNSFSISRVTTFNDTIFIHFDSLSEDSINEPVNKMDELQNFYKIVFKLREVLCSCPALEYIISRDYIKVYLDLPNVYTKDIIEMDRLFETDSVLELGSQRPYALYIREGVKIEEENH